MKDILRTDFQTRQYMKSEGFEVFYYSDTSLPTVELHRHDHYEFYFFIEGNVRIQVESEKLELCPGDFIIIPPNTYHRPFVDNMDLPYRRFILWLSDEYMNRLFRRSDDFRYMIDLVKNNKEFVFHNNRIAFNSLQSKLIKLLDENRNERFGKSCQLEICLNDLLLTMNRIIHNDKNPKQAKAFSLLDRITEYIEENLESDLSLDALAKQFCVSKYHFSHLFKDTTGISLHQFITKKRLELAKNYILGGMNINESYESSGFGDYSSFYRAFKKEYGITPSDFKKKNTVYTNK